MRPKKILDVGIQQDENRANVILAEIANGRVITIDYLTDFDILEGNIGLQRRSAVYEKHDLGCGHGQGILRDFLRRRATGCTAVAYAFSAASKAVQAMKGLGDRFWKLTRFVPRYGVHNLCEILATGRE